MARCPSIHTLIATVWGGWHVVISSIAHSKFGKLSIRRGAARWAPKSTKLAAIHVKSCCPSFTQLSAGISSINSKKSANSSSRITQGHQIQMVPNSLRCLRLVICSSLIFRWWSSRTWTRLCWDGSPVTWVVLGWFKPFQNYKLQVKWGYAQSGARRKITHLRNHQPHDHK